MNKNFFVKPLPILALVIAVPGLKIQASNLLPEGNFEILNHVGMPEGWKLPDPRWYRGFGGNVTVEQEEGNNFLRLESAGMDKLFEASFTVDLPPEARSIRLSYRVRAEVRDVSPNDGSGVGVTLIRWWGNEEKKQARYAHTDWITSTTPGWVEKEDFLTVPEGMTKLTVYPAIRHASAIADFDDITIEVED